MGARPGRGVQHHLVPDVVDRAGSHLQLRDQRPADEADLVAGKVDAVGGEPVHRGRPGDEDPVEHGVERAGGHRLVAVAVVELDVGEPGVPDAVGVLHAVVDIERRP